MQDGYKKETMKMSPKSRKQKQEAGLKSRMQQKQWTEIDKNRFYLFKENLKEATDPKGKHLCAMQDKHLKAA